MGESKAIDEAALLEQYSDATEQRVMQELLKLQVLAQDESIEGSREERIKGAIQALWWFMDPASTMAPHIGIMLS